ncbi:translation initiation factor IF-2, mitochondrial isoform X1 [Rhopalosiphum padi]|uniref:translation initiation factor IF-2, mitochondrial isoform X1 n=2 Tax=Rhopalosiphum padi TaxID=40932 RepID=UPI00298E85D3|nr:translation initiation factor IF-2, mitochondrial isoform X1 [Rhopalosiphum padi]XP_060841243.1 translation initiation factor IF-2, mitochondrial isoform X1 [Rhopalosiphum padi]
MFNTAGKFSLLSNLVRSSQLRICYNEIFKANIYSSNILRKKRKPKEEKKNIIPPVIDLKPKQNKTIDVWKNMTVLELANATGIPVDNILKIIELGQNSHMYFEPTSLIDNVSILREIVKKCGFKSNLTSNPNTNKKPTDEHLKDAIKRPPAPYDSTISRPPVVTIMGHVDHGKTTLLDTLRNASVAKSEFGAITQHIGAFPVVLENGKKITFLDTPGHAAFATIRSRGAHVTDIVVLVVAADDGVKEQTIESIRMAKHAKVPIIVAINKIDKPTANIERCKKMLQTQGGLDLEEFGGSVQVVQISALHGTNFDGLIESILTQAEILDLRADPNPPAEGVIIESKLDNQKGKLATVLVQRGKLLNNSILVAGNTWGKVRTMMDHQNNVLREANPSDAIQLIGWKNLPQAGQEFLQVSSDKRAREVIDYRISKSVEQKQNEDSIYISTKLEEHNKEYQSHLAEKKRGGIFRRKRFSAVYQEKQLENRKNATDDEICLNVVVKGDVIGSVEAILDVLETYESNQCKLDIIHYGVGNVCVTDIEYADAFKAIVYAFNVDSLKDAEENAKQNGITIKQHNIIYKLVDDIKEEMNNCLPPVEVEDIQGEANVIQEFLINENKKKIPVAGCRCTSGTLKKAALFKVIRDYDTVLYRGKLSSMRHLKDEVATIKTNMECGIRLEDTNIRLNPGDKIVCYTLREQQQKITWETGF